MIVQITKTFEFEAAHCLEHHEGKCQQMHGHTYKLQVTVEGIPQPVTPDNPESGMIMDFGTLKFLVATLIGPKLDHRNLNESFPTYPTAELLAFEIFMSLDAALQEVALHSGRELSLFHVARVRLYETSTSYAEVIA